MPDGGHTARRYAEAVFELARETDSLQRWQDEFGLLAEVYDDPRVAFFFQSPRRSVTAKWETARRMFEGRIGQDVLNFFLLLIDRDRTELIPRVRERFDALVREASGVQTAEVTTAIELNEEEQRRIAEELGRITGKRIELQTRVDPAIIGGMVARIGDKLIDGSVATSLRQLRQRLT